MSNGNENDIEIEKGNLNLRGREERRNNIGMYICVCGGCREKRDGNTSKRNKYKLNREFKKGKSWGWNQVDWGNGK